MTTLTKKADAHKIGRIGGFARAAALTPEQRTEIASNAAKARWTGTGRKKTVFSLTDLLAKHEDLLNKKLDAINEVKREVLNALEQVHKAQDALTKQDGV